MSHILETRSLRAFASVLLAAALALPISGCDTDKIVAVEDPGELRPEDLGGAGAVPALVAGATRQFTGGYSGFGLDDAFIVLGGAMSDEFYWGDTFTTRQAFDIRSTQPSVIGNSSDAGYNRLHQARFNARRAFGVVQEFTSPATAAADAATQAQLRTIEGYVYVTFSEGWCGAVPFSKLPDTGPIDPFAVEFGAPLSTAQMNDTAVVRFDQGLALNANNRLAAVGKGRALLNNGQYAAAAAAVAAVPTTFVFRLEHSSNESTENNPVNSLQGNGRWGVSNLEGGATAAGTALSPAAQPPPATAPGGSAEGLNFRAASDPRIPWQGRASSNNVCFSSAVRCWLNNNYPTFDADIPMASGVEARLIEAEADLQAGNGPGMITRLNALRAAAATLIPNLYPSQIQVFPMTLNPLVDPVTPEGRRDLLFRERAFWMFNTGHRQGDLRRLVRQYGLPSSQVFPSGPYFRGGNYGNDVAFPVPFAETNNPQFNLAACVTTQA
jgi:hypothetical protein